MYSGKTPDFIFISEPFLWMITFIFLADALRRIKSVVKSLTNCVINY